MSSSRHFFEIAGIFCLSLILFTWGVGSQEVIGFESRFYLFALEMWHDGPSWFPTTYHQFYPDYPATSTFLIYLVASIMGHMNKLAAVIPSAVAAAITVVLTYQIGSLHKKRWGLYAIFMLFFTILFLKSARSITLDMYTAMITSICFYIIYSADLKNNHSREWFLYPLLVAGFAFRGPIGLIIPAGVICIYYLQERNYKNLFFSGVFALLLLMLCTLLLLTIAHIHGGHEFVHDVLRMEMIGRLQENHLPAYFYLTASLKDYAISFPLALVVCLGIIYYEHRLHHHSPELKLLLKLFGWMAIILLGMSIPGEKKIRYVLAIVPAIALLASYPLIAPKNMRYFSWFGWLLVRFFLVVPVILFIILRRVMTYAAEHAIDFHIDYLLVTQILFVSLAAGAFIYVCFGKRQHWRDTGIIFVGTFSFIMSYLMVAEPIEQYADKTHEFVAMVEMARQHAQADLLFYKETSDGLAIKYVINMPSAETPHFIDDENQLLSYHHPAFVVSRESYFQALSPEIAAHFHVVARQPIGHVPVVVFTNT